MRAGSKKRRALQGIKVLDLAWVGPGPFCATILGDLGADIIKIHEPDPERRGGLVKYALPDIPTFPGIRNCRVMGLDLKAKEGRDVFYELAKTADVVAESYRPGVMKRLGIDYKAVSKVNPRIVYAAMTSYGQDGPYRDLPGHDINYVSVGGLLGMTGESGGAPVIPGTLIADLAAGGMSAVIGILAALMARESTGRGQFVDVSITDGIVALMSMWIDPYLHYGMNYKRGETMFTGLYPWYNVYETKDGKYISIGAIETWFYKNLCQLLGRDDFIEHQYTGGEKHEEMFRYFRETFLTKTRDEWLKILRQKDTCVAPVYSVEELVSDPQLLARGTIMEISNPTLGSVKQVSSMLKMSASPFKVRNWARSFGEHTDEILRELGYSKARIKALRKSAIIG